MKGEKKEWRGEVRRRGRNEQIGDRTELKEKRKGRIKKMIGRIVGWSVVWLR